MQTQILRFDETKKQKSLMFADRQFLVSLDFSDSIMGLPGEIHILPKGKWDHPVYGEMEITDKDIELFMQHFNDGLRRDIPITEGHPVDGEEKPAIGWFKKLVNRENGLWAVVEWTKQGADLLAQKAYKYFSPEFHQVYEDPETRKTYDDVLVGGALTNKPYFKGLAPVLMSENTIKYFEEKTTMDIKELMKKKPSELTAEEKAYMKSCKEKMSEAEQATFKAVFDEAGGGEKTEEEKKTEADATAKAEADKAKADADAKVAADKEATDKAVADAAEKEKVEASEKNMVKISAGELKALQSKADEGAKAFAELKTAKLNNLASTLVFSEQNSKGKILPKGKDGLVKFMEILTDKQLESFQEVMKSVPDLKLFGEVGALDAKEQGEEGTGSAKERVFAETEKLMKADTKLKFSDAVKQLGRTNPKLMGEYEKEISAK